MEIVSIFSFTTRKSCFTTEVFIVLTELSKELTKKQVNFIKKDCEDP